MKALTSLALFAAASSAVAQDKPPLPFEDVGACPFECCTYREWETVRPLTLHKERSEKSAVVYRAKPHEKVQGLTGVVVTRKFGVTRVLKPTLLGFINDEATQRLSIGAGEMLYTLHYEGEGYELFWYKGRTYRDQIAMPEEGFKIESHPKYDWWVQVKTQDGLVGWSKEPDAFTNMDACG